MHSLLFPTTIVDDFLHEPFQYVEFAKSLEFASDPEGRWPGLRTKNLVIDYPDLVHHIVKKIMSLFFNFLNEKVDWRVGCYFQKVNTIYSNGWIHSDPNQLTSLIYFCNSGFGTSLYGPKDITNFKGVINGIEKRQSYINLNKLEEYKNFKKENNNQFSKIVTVDSKFNRLFCFEGGTYHGVDNFVNDKNQEDRLTMILFISNITTEHNFPITRSKFLYE